ncbi:hypothetical protein [Aquimarina sediminis]|uniref:hypothetical protein n=1 Tax=Aquimarina sediminis TaxID=2070536 RepID=UPI000FFF54E5|nr:hypothetical protein [Aquimarina sediminis]
MASGKQILLSLLSEYSQKMTASNQIKKVTERIKSGLLLHGSTANFMWKTVEQLAWVQQAPNIELGDNEVKEQGLGLKDANLLLSDLFGLITESEGIPENIKEMYPEITPEAYQAGTHIIWSLLKALEWSKTYEGVENSGQLDINEKERLLNRYEQKLVEYRNDPEDFS